MFQVCQQGSVEIACKECSLLSLLDIDEWIRHHDGDFMTQIEGCQSVAYDQSRLDLFKSRDRFISSLTPFGYRNYRDTASFNKQDTPIGKTRRPLMYSWPLGSSRYPAKP